MILYARTVCPPQYKSAVIFKVRRLRKEGRPLSRAEFANAPVLVGNIVTHAVDLSGQRYNVATLRASDPMVDSLVPDLYEPVLLWFSVLAFRLRGFERVESPRGAIGVVQEWHCEAP